MKIEAHYLKFLFGGGISVSLDWSLFIFLSTQLNFNFMISKAVGYVAGTLFAFIFNGLITFRTHLSVFKFKRHLAVYFFSLLLNITVFNLTMKLLPSLFGLNKLIALLAATGISISTNFIGMRFWVFQRNASVHE
jgi:putative flippase GtrA